jgi:zinc protease
LGNKETIEKISRDDIVEYYERLVVPKNMVIAIAGDIVKEEAVRKIRDSFKDFTGKEPNLPSPQQQTQANKKEEIKLSMEREQSLVIMGFPSVSISNDDRYAFEVIDSLMAGISGRMHTNIRDRLGMAYSVGTSFIPGIEPGCYIFYALTSLKNIEKIKKAMISEIESLKDKHVDGDELEAAKAELITAHMMQMQKNSNFGMRIALDELYGLGHDNYKKFIEKIDGVDSNAIKSIANKYFDMSKNVTLVIEGKK